MQVDLRAAYSKTYNQGPDNACGPFAVCNALDTIHERAAGKEHRADPYQIWDKTRFYDGWPGQNNGTKPGTLIKVLSDMGYQAMRTWFNTLDDLKHILSSGVPIVFEMRVTDGFYNRTNDGLPWKTHEWTMDTARVIGQHFMVIQGFDDDAGRFLIENSWGSDWGDGGYWGLPYHQFQRVLESLIHINLAPVPFKPVEGFKPMPTTSLFSYESAGFVDRSKAALKNALVAGMEMAGPQGVIDTAKEFGISDKHIELLMGWDRGAVRKFKDENSGLNWDGFVWDQV